MATNNALFLDGQSITRPSMFNGVNYVIWKECMEIFLQSIDIELWYIIDETPYEGTILPKNKSELRD